MARAPTTETRAAECDHGYASPPPRMWPWPRLWWRVAGCRCSEHRMRTIGAACPCIRPDAPEPPPHPHSGVPRRCVARAQGRIPGDAARIHLGTLSSCRMCGPGVSATSIPSLGTHGHRLYSSLHSVWGECGMCVRPVSSLATSCVRSRQYNLPLRCLSASACAL